MQPDKARSPLRNLKNPQSQKRAASAQRVKGRKGGNRSRSQSPRKKKNAEEKKQVTSREGTASPIGGKFPTEEGAVSNVAHVDLDGKLVGIGEALSPTNKISTKVIGIYWEVFF